MCSMCLLLTCTVVVISIKPVQISLVTQRANCNVTASVTASTTSVSTPHRSTNSRLSIIKLSRWLAYNTLLLKHFIK